MELFWDDRDGDLGTNTADWQMPVAFGSHIRQSGEGDFMFSGIAIDEDKTCP